jgi:hypothetical protein
MQEISFRVIQEKAEPNCSPLPFSSPWSEPPYYFETVSCGHTPEAELLRILKQQRS